MIFRHYLFANITEAPKSKSDIEENREYLKQIEVAETRKMDIYFSPSLEVENKANKNGLTISAVGDPEDPEFYIFYKRPISVVKKQFFRKPQTVVEDYVSEITGQTKEDVIECLNALIKNDQEFLRRKIA